MKIKHTRGDTWPDKIIVRDVAKSLPANLTGCIVLLTVDSREFPDDSSTRLHQINGTIPVPTSGEVIFTPTLGQTDHVGLFYYDIQMTIPQGAIITIQRGAYEFVQDITK